MWNAAGNNLITLAGPNRELTVDTTAANPLFTLVPGGGGPAKIASLPFARFHGNVFWLLSLILFCLFYVLSHYSPFLSLIDEREQFSPNSSRSPFAIHINPLYLQAFTCHFVSTLANYHFKVFLHLKRIFNIIQMAPKIIFKISKQYNLKTVSVAIAFSQLVHLSKKNIKK